MTEQTEVRELHRIYEAEPVDESVRRLGHVTPEAAAEIERTLDRAGLRRRNAPPAEPQQIAREAAYAWDVVSILVAVAGMVGWLVGKIF